MSSTIPSLYGFGVFLPKDGIAMSGACVRVEMLTYDQQNVPMLPLLLICMTPINSIRWLVLCVHMVKPSRKITDPILISNALGSTPKSSTLDKVYNPLQHGNPSPVCGRLFEEQSDLP